MVDIKSQKNIIRAEVKARLALITESSKNEQSHLIVQKLRELIDDKGLSKVALFAAMAHEVDLLPLVHLMPDVDFYFPVCLKKRQLEFRLVRSMDDFHLSLFGIREPVASCESISANDLDMVVVPACAYTNDGKRLGYGGGYYDTLMSQNANPYYVGVCLREQICEQLPTEDHDLILQRLITT